MEERIFTVSTDDGESRDVRATHFLTDERIVTFYRETEGVIVATFNLDHVISVVSVKRPTPVG